MPALRVAHLDKSFGRLRAVQDLTLTVERDCIFGLLGSNGSGKTTTINCALGLLRPDKGTAEVLGVPSRRIPETRGRVGVVFDQPTLVPGLSARRNLEYARRLLGHDGGRSLGEALELVGIGELADTRAGDLSLGQKRRLSIARALLGRPELLVLDEPLSGLDTLGVSGMLELFRSLAGDGLTLVLSSHRLHEMERVVTHVGIIAAGRLVAEGTLDDVLGGREPTLRVRADPIERAAELLAEGSPRREAGVLHVTPGGRAIPEIARALVEGGCDVHELTPERATLQSVFESLVDGAAR